MSSALDIIVFIIQVLTGFVLLYGIYRVYKFYRSYVFDKRFGPYSVELLEDDSDSLFDNISYCIYNDQADDILMQGFKLDKIHQGIPLKGVVSRKIQIVPYYLLNNLHER